MFICGEVIDVEVKDMENGLYEVVYVFKVEGIYILVVKVGD